MFKCSEKVNNMNKLYPKRVYLMCYFSFKPFYKIFFTAEPGKLFPIQTPYRVPSLLACYLDIRTPSTLAPFVVHMDRGVPLGHR
jgi:hypothetical protein